MRARVFWAITEMFDKIYDGNLRTNFTIKKIGSANCECKLKRIVSHLNKYYTTAGSISQCINDATVHR